MDQDETLHAGRPRVDPGHIVLDGDPAPPKGHNHPSSWPISVVAKWLDGSIKMSLSMMVGLGPGNIVLDADPAPPEGVQPPQFLVPCLLSPNGWMDQDTSW